MRGFLIKFVGLSIVSGSTIGISKILITVFGLSLQATNWQLGLIGAAETLGLALGTIPAGIMVSRGSPRALYGKASAIVAVCYLLIPRLGVWFALLPLMLFTGFCISYRIVSMSSIFLGQLGAMGNGWAGWYKGTLALGTMAIGPWMGHLLTKGLGIKSTFYVSAGLFAGMATIGLLALPPTDGNGARRSRRRTGNCLRPIWQNRQVRLACFMEGLSGYCSAFFSTFMLVILMRDHGWARDRAVHLFVLNGVVYVSVLLGAGWVLSKRGPRYPRSRDLWRHGGGHGGAWPCRSSPVLRAVDRGVFVGAWIQQPHQRDQHLVKWLRSWTRQWRGHVDADVGWLPRSLCRWAAELGAQGAIVVCSFFVTLAGGTRRPARYRLDSTVNEESIVVGSLKYAHQPPIGQHLIDMLGDEALAQSQEK